MAGGTVRTIHEVSVARRRCVRLARAALFWERLWPALWPGVFVAGVFVALSLFGVWRFTPGWLHVALLAAFAVALFGVLARGLRRLEAPGETEAVRRIELASGLAHRPLGTLDDRPLAAPSDTVAQALWRAHLKRVLARAGRLRVGIASPGMARHDPIGLRAVLVLVLVVAFAAAGDGSTGRLARAFQPDFSAPGPTGPGELTLWITPPHYTGAAPIFLTEAARPPSGAAPAAVRLPVGSTVLARVHGGAAVPELAVDDVVVPFDAIDQANFEISAALDAGARLAVTQGGHEIAAWPIALIVDQPPLIEFSSPPSRTYRAALRLDYIAEDDYGLASVHAIIRRLDDTSQSFALDLSLLRAGTRAVDDSSFHDLTPHPWAGLQVTIALRAVDGLGQTGDSEAIPTLMPERIFNHPVARAVIEQRKALTIDPTKRDAVRSELDKLVRDPRHFFEDLKVFLGLRVASARLRYDRSDKVIAELQDLLWDIALSIEEGPVALAEQELREAQQALMDALNSDASDEEIERLMDELRETLDKFLAALAEQAAQRSDLAAELREELDQAIQRDELMEMLEHARELYRTGSREAARDLLARLQEMLENLKAGRMAASSDQGPGQGEAALRNLENLMQQQQQLLDQTFRWAQQGPESWGQDGPARIGKGSQEALHRRLGELMLQWSETGLPIPRPLGRAERAMREAGRSLGEQLPGQAVGAQSEALDHMQQGSQSMLEAMLEQLERGPQRPGGNLGMFNGARDPLGRGVLGYGYQDDGRTRVPDEAELQRSRTILEELYRRSGELSRPGIERDYINRLLQRF